MFTVDDYDQALDRLLPRGPIWKRVPGSMLDSVLHSIAIELARIDTKATKFWMRQIPGRPSISWITGLPIGAFLLRACQLCLIQHSKKNVGS